VTTSEYDSVRPPEPPDLSRWGRRRRRRARSGGGDGAREMPLVPEADFTSYYDRPVVKPAPWGWDVAAYLFLGGVAGGSAVLGAGGQLTGRATLRRNCRLAALASVSLGAIALVRDLGRPERFVNMLRVIKLTSPMSLGSWILSAFSAGAAVAAAAEVDLAVYTAVLLADTSTPTWNHAHDELPFVFVSSASLAAAGLAMITTPVAEAAPARKLAVLGVIGDLVATGVMHRRMDPVAAEPLHQGRPGTLLRLSQGLAVAGGIGTVLGGRRRPVAAAAGLALMAASALTRFGIYEAGIRSAKDPRYTIEPQKRRLAARRAAGITDDSITTAG
jgi:formate-dependent nitrite reductase membrane component NrfD